MTDSDNTMEIIVVGLGASGLYAAKSALSQNRQGHVTIIEKRDFDQFSPCGLPFVIEGIVPDFEHLKHVVPEVKGKLSKLLRHEVLSVDHDNRTLKVRDLSTNEDKDIGYDALILSNGSIPVNLPIPGAKELLGKGVFFCSSIDDSSDILETALNAPGKRAVVVGGGAIGLEVAVALKERGLDVCVTKRTPPPFPRNLDPEMGKLITDHLIELGIDVRFGKGIDAINGSDIVTSVTIQGEEVPCDLVVMAVGTRPNTSLAESTGCLTVRDGIVVDNRMETTVKGIFATGDCVRTYSRIDGTSATMQLATSAFRQGMVAGTNAAGGNVGYDGVLNTFLTKIGRLEIASTGYTLEQAKALGYDAIGISTRKEIKPHYMPDCPDINLRVVCEKIDGRILGFQAVGEQGAGWRANIFALAIQARMTLQDIMDAELSYNPPVSQMYDPIYQLVEIALKRLRLEFPSPKEVFIPDEQKRW
ncbi:MAG: FAD-dependent oxidoreductase [Candidatus Thermoplasmatota archaeon]|nr:FAD-dependent oxidoreductase [Candidatus Thermoplasmatota archaeon]